MRIFGSRRAALSDADFELSVVTLAKECDWGMSLYELEGEFDLEVDEMSAHPIKLKG